MLSIAALLLGFGPLRAFDIDPLAVDATRRNAERNGVDVEVARADALTDPLPSAPLWLANLELHLLEPLLGRGTCRRACWCRDCSRARPWAEASGW